MKIYTRTTCAPCKALKKWLTNKGVDYEEIDVDSDITYANEVINLTGRLLIPTVVKDNKVVSGFNLSEISKLI